MAFVVTQQQAERLVDRRVERFWDREAERTKTDRWARVERAWNAGTLEIIVVGN